MQDAKDATDAAAYTRQLYTSLGVGLSSTSVRRPMMAIDDLPFRTFDVVVRGSRRWSP